MGMFCICADLEKWGLTEEFIYLRFIYFFQNRFNSQGQTSVYSSPLLLFIGPHLPRLCKGRLISQWLISSSVRNFNLILLREIQFCSPFFQLTHDNQYKNINLVFLNPIYNLTVTNIFLWQGLRVLNFMGCHLLSSHSQQNFYFYMLGKK